MSSEQQRMQMNKNCKLVLQNNLLRVGGFLLIIVTISVNGNFYISNYEFSINRNIKATRNLIAGERERYDGEITTYDATEKKSVLFFSTHTFKYHLVGSKITCIFITNMLSHKIPFYVTLIDGGIGKNFVILEIKSGWRSSLNVRITLYGFTGRLQITGPTQPIPHKNLRNSTLKKYNSCKTTSTVHNMTSVLVTTPLSANL